MIFQRNTVDKKEGVDYFYSALNNSVQHYQEEFDLFVDNPLLKQFKESLTLSSSHIIKLVNGEVSLNNDTDNKILNGTVKLDSLPVGIDFYVTDEKLILGSEPLVFLESDIKTLSASINEFTLKNGLYHYGELIEKILMPLDLSYTSLTSLNIIHPFEVTKDFWSDYKDTFKNLFDKSIYTQSVNSDEVINVEISPERDDFYNWMINDFIPKVKSDASLKIKLSSLYIDYNKFIAILDNFIYSESDFSVNFKFSIHNDIITTAYIEYGYGDNIVVAEIMALGTENNIDDLKFFYESKNFEIEIAAIGSHADPELFSSKISSTVNGITQEEISILWDSDKSSDGFETKIEPDRVIISHPQGEKNIVLMVPEYKYIPLESWEILNLEKSLQVPENTIQIKDATLISLLGRLGELGIWK